MENDRKLLILKSLRQQIEDALEAATMGARLCVKVKDEKGAEETKKQAIAFELKLKECDEIEKELKTA